eukprot:COSAG02_NODE_978_length_15497_cov_11.288349_10_plen_203_part_00
MSGEVGRGERQGEVCGKARFGFRPTGLGFPSLCLAWNRQVEVSCHAGVLGAPRGVCTALEQASRVETVARWIGFGGAGGALSGLGAWELRDPRDPRDSGAHVGGLQGFPFPVLGVGALGRPLVRPPSPPVLCAEGDEGAWACVARRGAQWGGAEPRAGGGGTARSDQTGGSARTARVLPQAGVGVPAAAGARCRGRDAGGRI